MTQRVLWLVSAVMVGGCVSGTPNDWAPGQTEFVNEEPTYGGGYPKGGADAGAAMSDAAGSPTPPQGRADPVEEAEIYRIDANRLFYLNTYKGLVIYDLNDPLKPDRISRLPIFGYPIEMFISGNTALALVKDALQMVEVKGKLEFKRKSVSQLVTIDLSDLAHPKVLQRFDIVGQLREGVSRKIGNTVYVVSYQPNGYSWGWGWEQKTNTVDTAHVYSFDVSDPKAVKEIGKLQLFEGKAYEVSLPGGGHVSKTFLGVAISATSNALMVVENWSNNAYLPSQQCGSYEHFQSSKVSMVDVSDPKGTIKVHTQFEQKGALGDQFKQTYLFDEQTGEATYLGIFARDEWGSGGCTGGQRIVQNYLVSVDVSDGKNPVELATVSFGKPNETVRGSVFDTGRKVAFAITARAMDPLYAISFADRKQLKVLSEIDGLSGDMSVFRFVEDRKFLLAVGQDNSSGCTGFESGWSSTQMAVSVIDVQDLTKIRLVQRACVAIEDGVWQSSAITQNQDQAHKMIGLYSEPSLNLIAVPVSYWEKPSENHGWWWYEQRSAVGIMRWDLSLYDPTLDHLQQKVLQNLSTFVHPSGQVRRSIFFKHGTTQHLMMATLSDTHLALTDLADPAHPKRLSEVEVAPFVRGVYRLGAHVVEAVTGQNPYEYYYGSQPQRTEFRVKAADKPIEEQKPLASFSVGGVSHAIAHGQKLVLFRPQQNDTYWGGMLDLLVYDLSNPAQPKQGGSVQLPFGFYDSWWWWGYYRSVFASSGGASWVQTPSGLAAVRTTWSWQSGSSTSSSRLYFVDLDDPSKPALTDLALPADSGWEHLGAVAADDEAGLVYVTARRKIGEKAVGEQTFALYKYYALAYRRQGGAWQPGEMVNVPGTLQQAFAIDGKRCFLTHDRIYEARQESWGTTWSSHPRLNLLRRSVESSAVKAAYQDGRLFEGWQLQDMVRGGSRLFVNAMPGYGGWYGGTAEPARDRLTIFELAGMKLDERFSATTGTVYSQLMGLHGDALFVYLPGDGLLVVDTGSAAEPRGVSFVPSEDRVSHVERVGDRALLAAGHRGVLEVDLKAVGALAE
jgi:hypothetical protein